MKSITVEKIIEIHDEVISSYEGTSGILSESTLAYLVYRLNRTKHVFRRAALALYAIASQHPFMDGNKRTALIVAENILGQDGFFLAVGEDQVVKFMLGVASYQYGPGVIEKWIHNNAEKME